MSKSLRLVLGDQLSLMLPTLQDAPPGATVALCEVDEEGRYVPHHPQKIAMMLAAMRHFAAELRQRGYRVHYSTLDDPDNRHSLIAEAERLAKRHGCDEIHVTRPGEWRLLKAMEARQTQDRTPRWRIVEDTRFFCSHRDFDAWMEGRKRPRMEDFYRMLRRRTGLLMDGNAPVGGQWNFDHDNRAPIDDAPSPPSPPRHRQDAVTREVLALVEKRFADHVGRLEGFNWPVTRRQALADLRHFVARALPAFGTYQDAISDTAPYLFHSRLSAALNIGLLSPGEVCEAAQDAWQGGEAPLNAVEGFIRQILGWREYVRGIYWHRMPAYKRENQLGATRGLPRCYWDGDTDLRCLQRAIEMTHDNAYAHHIQRLMVTGNFALLCDVRPAALCDWYLAVYADACEWVELPNTLGMVLHADGGYLGSKPYCASGKYIDRMSDHCAQCRYDPRQSVGENACPFNALYWRFLERHADQLADNPRMRVIYGTLDKMSAHKRQALRQQADTFLDSLTWTPPYGQGQHASDYGE
ncbi:cryptochrome/photolyase family protein [Chromohalobacter salexigens]|uniref:cryptochrome/photolyase family protein n=1 Tax=Chromohalobacter israelensis TaxID=141390 RepID=UPI0032E89585